MRIDACRIGFVGFGHMAKIICRCLERSKLVPRSQIRFLRRDPGKMLEDQHLFGITSTTLETLVKESDILLLCVRPGDVDILFRSAAWKHLEGKLIISILAGAKLSYLKKNLPQASLIRAMPNLCSQVGEGMTILSFDSGVDADRRGLARTIFSCMGRVIELPEASLDIATAIAGSGPAYVLSLIESAARAGEKEGIPYPVSLEIAAQTFLGSAALVLNESAPVDQLLLEIAVRGGTTEAGIRVMKEMQLESNFQKVFTAAAERSAAMSNEFNAS